MVVRADPTLIAHAIADQVTSIVAATVRFLLLDPQSWVSGRILPDERAEVEQVVAGLLGLRAVDLAAGPCPLCQHEDCVQGCPVAAARAVVRRV